jgi:hypothetical protein
MCRPITTAPPACQRRIQGAEPESASSPECKKASDPIKDRRLGCFGGWGSIEKSPADRMVSSFLSFLATQFLQKFLQRPLAAGSWPRRRRRWMPT